MIQATIACNIFIYDLRYCVLWRMLLFFKWFAQFGRERFPWLQRLWPRRPWQRSQTTPGELSGEAIEIASSKFSKSWRSCHILPFWNKDFCQVNSSFRNFHFYPNLGSGIALPPNWVLRKVRFQSFWNKQAKRVVSSSASLDCSLWLCSYPDTVGKGPLAQGKSASTYSSAATFKKIWSQRMSVPWIVQNDVPSKCWFHKQEISMD